MHTLQSVLMTTSHPLQPTLWRTCRALANRTRLRMFGLLMKEPGLTVSAVSQRLDLALPVASQYLRALEARGLVTARRSGRWVHYQLPRADAERPVGELVASIRLVFQRDARPEEKLFKLATAFTHPRRIEVFRALQHHTWNFGQLKAATRLSAWSLRRHLGKLERRGFVRQQRNFFTATYAEGAVGRALARLAST